MTRVTIKLAFVLVALLMVGCDDQAASDQPLLRISVDAGGAVLMNEIPVSPQQALSMISDSADSAGVVWYYADETFANPNPIAENITDALVAAHLHVVRSAHPDFSDLLE